MSSLTFIGTSYLGAERRRRSGFGDRLMLGSKIVAVLISCSLDCGSTALMCGALGALMGSMGPVRFNDQAMNRLSMGEFAFLLFARAAYNMSCALLARVPAQNT